MSVTTTGTLSKVDLSPWLKEPRYRLHGRIAGTGDASGTILTNSHRVKGSTTDPFQFHCVLRRVSLMTTSQTADLGFAIYLPAGGFYQIGGSNSVQPISGGSLEHLEGYVQSRHVMFNPGIYIGIPVDNDYAVINVEVPNENGKVLYSIVVLDAYKDFPLFAF